MSLQASLGQRQEQRLALLPQMLQSIEVLQLATADLLQLLELEASQNETLELRPHDGEELVAERSRGDDPQPDFETMRRPVAADGEDTKSAFLANVAAAGDELLDFVREQLAFRRLPALLTAAVIKLVEQLDDRGLLPFSLPQLAADLDLPLELLEAAHEELLTLEPLGLGASDAIAAMLLQAQGDPDLVLIERLLREHLADLGRNRLPEVARAVGVTLADLGSLLERIKTLRPAPAAAYRGKAAAPVQPDAFVWLRDGQLQVALDDRMLPEVGIVAEYAAMAADRQTDREVRDYLRPKLRSARDLAEAVAQRQATLQRVVMAVMREQLPFLQQGRSAIRPLRMSEVAERLSLHTSTVSRAIAGKHVQTERGLFRLRDFFDGGRGEGQKAEGAAGQGRMAVAQQIADLIAAEDAHKPLSDDDLVAALQRRGVHAARRTITKYRKELGIPASYQRRRHGDPS